ncbi:uncharacterized protein TNCV_467381 [Trichonephila clavipes]|nr:uncharacterized protein TNCV_467381 [Trichonephila clavipes]
MILACEQESSFEDVWKGKIRYEFPNSGRAKKFIKIKSAFHLVRTIMYVSQPKSSCDKDEIPDNLRNPEHLSHFHINQPLHPHSIAFLCTLFPGGIEKLLWEQVGNKNVAKWEKTTRRRADTWGNFKWSVPIQVTGWKFLNCVIPFRYEKTEELIPLYLNLYEWAMDQKVILKAKLNEMKAKNDLIQRERDLIKEEIDAWKIKEQELKTKENELKTKENKLKSKENSLKAPAHLMILTAAKMNSLDYDDFIDMFSVPTPLSPLPPIPVASPSHEPSQDVIYDSLPPMEQSTVSESL